MRTDDTMDTASLGRMPSAAPRRLALVIAWSRTEPWRAGEALVLGRNSRADACMIGRGPGAEDDATRRARFVRQRPGADLPQPPLESAGISRAQLVARVGSGGVHLDNRGKRRLLVDGVEQREAVLAPGQLAELDSELLLRVERRPEPMPAAQHWPEQPRTAFGAADAFGIVGESPATWALRDELAFAAGRSLHVLLFGPSGSGKELAAGAIHAMAQGGPWVARNAATLPEGLVEAELFGNVRDFPNPGMKERRGLVGAADGGTLFLDELGELPEAQQARLLRVLDSGGEYHRLGEDRARRSRLRLVAATNRSVAQIKHDLLARLTVRVSLPPLDARRSDVPLLCHHLVRTMADDDPAMERFIEATPHGRFARIRPDLLAELLRDPLELGVRELSTRLWDSARRSVDTWLTPGRAPQTQAPAREAEVDPAEVSAAQIRAALEESGGVVSRAYRALGLQSRHVLHRLMRKHGIER